MDRKTKETIASFQKNEITEHIFYEILAKRAKEKNAEILKKISKDELRHYKEWKKYSNKDVKPCKLTILKYFFNLQNFWPYLCNKIDGKRGRKSRRGI